MYHNLIRYSRRPFPPGPSDVTFRLPAHARQQVRERLKQLPTMTTYSGWTDIDDPFTIPSSEASITSEPRFPRLRRIWQVLTHQSPSSGTDTPTAPEITPEPQHQTLASGATEHQDPMRRQRLQSVDSKSEPKFHRLRKTWQVL